MEINSTNYTKSFQQCNCPTGPATDRPTGPATDRPTGPATDRPTGPATFDGTHSFIDPNSIALYSATSK